MSEEQCASILSQLPGLIAMGMITTAKANAIRGACNAVLQYHQKGKGSPGQERFEDADVLTLLRTNPQMMAVIEPMLTSTQLELVLKDAKDGGNGKA